MTRSAIPLVWGQYDWVKRWLIPSVRQVVANVSEQKALPLSVRSRSTTMP